MKALTVVCLLLIITLWAMGGFKLPVVVLRILYKLFDYRFIYVIGTTAGRQVKVGIAYDAVDRTMDINKSIKGSTERLIYAARVFGAYKHEQKFRKRFATSNKVWKGSGKTEWHWMKKDKAIGAIKRLKFSQTITTYILSVFLLYIILILL